jgi:hypothetical protein
MKKVPRCPVRNIQFAPSLFGMALRREFQPRRRVKSNSDNYRVIHEVMHQMDSMDVDTNTKSPKAISPSVSDVPPEIWRLVGEQVRWTADLAMAHTVKGPSALFFSGLVAMYMKFLPWNKCISRRRLALVSGLRFQCKLFRPGYLFPFPLKSP